MLNLQFGLKYYLVIKCFKCFCWFLGPTNNHRHGFDHSNLYNTDGIRKGGTKRSAIALTDNYKILLKKITRTIDCGFANG